MRKKSIIIKEFYHKELAKIAKTFGVNYGDLIESMITYFKKTGINPVEAINENPATMVKVLDKRIVSFLKVQERDILKPLRNEVFEYSNLAKRQYENSIKKYEDLSDWHQDTIIKIDRFDKNRTNMILAEFAKIKEKDHQLEKVLILIAELLDSKNKTGLQNKIKSIFE